MGILDNAKEVANAVHEIKNLELYGRVLNLNAGIMDLVEENRRFREEIEDLKKKLHLQEKMTFKVPFYYQDGDATPYCPACWESKNAAIHVTLSFDNHAATGWVCPSCQNNYRISKNRPPQLSTPTGSPWG